MQVRLAKHLEETRCDDAGPLNVDEFFARFPEVPHDLHAEPVVAEYVAAFGALLRRARKPTPCMGKDGGDAEEAFYTRLVNDLAIYGVGLARRDRTLARVAKL